MTEANKLGLLRAAAGGATAGEAAVKASSLVTKIRALAEGEGPAKRCAKSEELKKQGGTESLKSRD